MPVKVKRLSDGAEIVLEDINPGKLVNSVKNRMRSKLPPKYKGGCRLIFNKKVLKSRHTLKHYRINDNDVIEMDDRKDWSSSSSSSDSED